MYQCYQSQFKGLRCKCLNYIGSRVSIELRRCGATFTPTQPLFFPHTTPVYCFQDGLQIVTDKPEMITNYHKAILTPNSREFERLYNKVVSWCTEYACQ